MPSTRTVLERELPPFLFMAVGEISFIRKPSLVPRYNWRMVTNTGRVASSLVVNSHSLVLSCHILMLMLPAFTPKEQLAAGMSRPVHG